ncbi:hypothetical protein GECvBN7_gp146 [Salmonella phage GEC_vB_N7]|uniref:Uncharacterized protein n=1 Tax=Salmonella phage GEC_vB_N7 TaxID=2777380 RepID=A0A7S9ST45_9CAUD|nr:hypothetical protein GECvBN7_gp146 [Salmonella phage GEC_vB_N7]
MLPIYHIGIIKWLLTFSPLRYILLSFSWGIESYGEGKQS